MADSYPYILSNKQVEPILSKIRSAARPARFSRELLKKFGFTASNDRAIINVLKELGFLTDSGAPTEAYDRLRHPTEWRGVLAEKMKELYSELFAIDENIHRASESEIKGAISRVTGKDELTVNRYTRTFRTLAGLANFDAEAAEEPSPTTAPPTPGPPPSVTTVPERGKTPAPAFYYNIQIHLPATTDVAVYNAIFRSLRDNLL